MLSRADLYPYQNRAVDFIKAHPFCALWVDVGLGKSCTALTAFDDLRSEFESRRVLIVGPLRVARKVWPDEIANWAHLNHLTYSRILGDPQQRWSSLKKPADVALVNRENFEWLMAQFIVGKKQVMRWPWDLVILDESHNYKSQSSFRWKAARKARRLCQRMVHLTGTPVPNGYADLWSQAFLLDYGQRLGSTEEAFLDRWFDAPGYGEFGYTIKRGAAEEIQALLGDVVLTLRESDYLDLPPVLLNPVKVELPPAALKEYKRLEREYLAEFGGRTITAVNAGVCAGKLLQLANGAVYHDRKGSWTHVHDTKLDALVELLESLEGKKVLIAYGYKHDRERIGQALTKFCGKSKRWEALTDDASENRWNRGETDYLLLHPAGGGEGSNLHGSGAEDIIWFGLTSSLGHWVQLNARLFGGHRRKGKKGVIHTIEAEDTADEDMAALIRMKDFTQDDLKAALVRRASVV